MYSNFKIKKVTGTYSDTIETFGLANLLNQIQNRLYIKHPKLNIEDKGLYYEILVYPEISIQDINQLTYFPIYQYAIKDPLKTFDEPFFDYPKQRSLKKEKQLLIQSAYKEYNGKEKAVKLKEQLQQIERLFEEEKYISPQLDVYTQVVTNNNFPVFEKLYENISMNKMYFSEIIRAILDNYSGKEMCLDYKKLKAFDKSVTALQIYNPNSGKGQNKGKASGAGATGVNSDWITEIMKISGSITNMLCQSVKVGRSYDLKIIVPDFKKVEFSKSQQIIQSFKKNIKGNTPLKVDILNLLIINKQLIENSNEYHNFKANNILTGLHSTYQKDLGQNKAVVNIAELQTPEFIEFNTEDEAKDWVSFLKEQITIVGSIDELGGAAQGLKAYRTFLTSSNFQSWCKFIFWYSAHVMSNLSKSKFALPLRIKSLNIYLKNIVMDNFKISEIISNEGFQKVAYAIRKSTVSLQYTPKDQRKFEIRYGLAQTLQNKSKSTADLTEFIGEFIGMYNSETARNVEKSGNYLRANVRENELSLFFGLLDKYPSKIIGALLVSYGFALAEKEASKNDIEEVEENIENTIE